jgi:nucleotide-binding universal stress UspA family protein
MKSVFNYPTRLAQQTRRPSQGRRKKYPRVELRKMMVPMDLFAPPFQALAYATALAKRFDGSIFLLNVIEPPSLLAGSQNGVVSSSGKGVSQRNRSRMVTLAEKVLSGGVPVIPLIRHGKPAPTIVRAAEVMRIDLIIIETRGNSGWKSMLWRDTSGWVARHGPCPVLTVRQEADAEAYPTIGEIEQTQAELAGFAAAV